MGTFDELVQSKLDFTELLASADETNEKPDEVKEASRPERKRTLSMGVSVCICLNVFCSHDEFTNFRVPK